MNVSSLEFLLALLAGSAAFVLLPGDRVRRLALAAANAAFLYSWLGADWRGWAILAAFLLSGYAVARFLARHPCRWTLTAYLAALIAAFVFLKKYVFVTALLPAEGFDWVVPVVGLSYMLFRQIHVLVDAMQGQIAALTLWSYLNYQLNLFALLAGPIQRFNDFQTYWQAPRPSLPDRSAVAQAYLRVMLGMIQIALLAPLALETCDDYYAYLDSVHLGQTDLNPWKVLYRMVGMFYLFPVYVYFNFAGYCDVVIGGASLVGLRLPENFDRPYLARNMLDFWNRWHRTLSYWIRDYLFTPMYKALAERWPAQAPSLAFLCFFVALFLAGVWHGSTWNFVVFGALHGVGVSAAKLWEQRLVARGGRKGLRQYNQRRGPRVAAQLATFHFVCVTFLFFRGDLDRCLMPLRVAAAALTGGRP